MKYFALTTLMLLLLLGLVKPAYAQYHPDDKRDAQWYLGYGSNTIPAYSMFGGTVMDFNDDTLRTYYQYRRLDFDFANASVCDSAGRVVCYSNGALLYDSTHHEMMGADTLSPGPYSYSWVSGTPVPDGVLILPWPDEPYKYIVLHQHYVNATFMNPNWQQYVDRLDYSIVGMNLNNGKGAVIALNQPLWQDTMDIGGLDATRHANGRDWWIIAPVVKSNCINVFLFTPQGVAFHHQECTGKTYYIATANTGAFSPDGNHYARIVTDWVYEPFYVETWGFDRCSGSLYNYWVDSTANPFIRLGIAFSANSRFLYAARGLDIVQYDMSSYPPVFVDTVGTLDGYCYQTTNPQICLPAQIGMLQLGPDNRIYASANADPMIGVVIHPDSLGYACDFRLHHIILPTYNSRGLPNLPYFKLGALQGSSCDTLNTGFSISGQVDSVSCYGADDGAIQLYVQSDASVYYLWSDSITTRDRTGLAPGSYSVTAMDAYRHTATLSFTIHEPPPLLVSAQVVNSISCYGGNTEVQINATGGIPFYTGIGTFVYPAGVHGYVVTDANGCASSDTFTITQPDSLAVILNAPYPLCYGDSVWLTVNAQGGIPPYTNTGQYQVAAGEHIYAVADANGCVTSDTLTIVQPDSLTISLTAPDPLCYGDSVWITVNAQGGTTPYSGTGQYQVSAGQYSYSIVDANGCNAAGVIVIPDKTPVDISISANAILCYGDAAQVVISATGGTPPYTGADTLFLNAGNHTAIVADANGCPDTMSFDIIEPDSLQVSITIDPADPLLNNGSIFVTTIGGTPPYIYSGIPDAGTAPPGTYPVTITDANGCDTTIFIFVPILDGIQVLSENMNGLNIFPNPATGYIEISFATPLGSSGGRLQLMDMSGRVVQERPLSPRSIGCNQWIADLPAGVYIVTVYDYERQALMSQRLLKR